MKNLALLGLLLLLVTGCSSLKTKDFNRIEVGMSKAQVIDKLGEPNTTHVQDGKEIMEYSAKDENGDKLPDGLSYKIKKLSFTVVPLSGKSNKPKKMLKVVTPLCHLKSTRLSVLCLAQYLIITVAHKRAVRPQVHRLPQRSTMIESATYNLKVRP